MIGFILGVTLSYLIYRLYRPQWVELGRIQTMLCNGGEIVVGGFHKDSLQIKFNNTTHSYSRGLSKFFIKQLRKGGHKL